VGFLSGSPKRSGGCRRGHARRPECSAGTACGSSCWPACTSSRQAGHLALPACDRQGHTTWERRPGDLVGSSHAPAASATSSSIRVGWFAWSHFPYSDVRSADILRVEDNPVDVWRTIESPLGIVLGSVVDGVQESLILAMGVATCDVGGPRSSSLYWCRTFLRRLRPRRTSSRRAGRAGGW
jgi:hypothetical protein